MRFYSVCSLLYLFCALLFIIGCSNEESEDVLGISLVEAIPPSGSTIQPYTPITVKFDGIPLELSCDTCDMQDGIVSEAIDISHSGKLSQSGKTATITGPFKSDGQLIIRLRWEKTSPKNSLVPNESEVIRVRNKSEVILTYIVVPEWTDGVITITAGKLKDRSKLQDMFRNEGWKSSNLHFGGFADEEFTLPIFAMAQEVYTVDIAIVPMIEVGIDEPATIETIRKRYLEHGYRPLSLEEMYELRLQFADQPEVSCVEEKTNAFHVLLSREDISAFSGDNDTIHDIDRSYSIPILLHRNNDSVAITGAPCRLSELLRDPPAPQNLNFWEVLYIDRIRSLTEADDDGWVLIPPRSDKYLRYATGYSSCETRFACVKRK